MYSYVLFVKINSNMKKKSTDSTNPVGENFMIRAT
ncbi:hypothetical protein CASFOL_040225 [Castilleja foliolosa]|uniref:Uncharacterized protein n=1 Tax=Castilleja foliolosa TaxID=1961234 RepID=A0ABD3BFS6_9LAMI